MMNDDEYTPCFSCKSKSLNIEGEVHRYMLSSPGCWAMYCEILEKEYSDFRYSKAHHYTVDAYSCQHPGEPGVSQAIKSVGIHLACFYMLFEREMNLMEAGNFKNKFSQHNKSENFIVELEPPSNLGEITIYDVWNSENSDDHFVLSKEWAKSTWNAWTAHHATIKNWTESFLNQEVYDFLNDKKEDLGD